MKKILLLSLLLSACAAEPEREGVETEPEITYEGIEGEWNASGTIDEGFQWFVSYTFEDGEYYKSGYPPIEETGSYEIQSQIENAYLVRLDPTDQEAFDVEVILSDDGKTLDLHGQTYQRVK